MVEWLKRAVFYEVYPQSFYDSNADGIGDIKGIIEKLDYIEWLGCNAIWLNPCFVSPFFDAGYDIADYYMVAPRYGTNEDLKMLFKKVHERGMHILLDLVPGHTAITHPWFKQSMKAERNEYTDRYIWTDSTAKKPDNITGIAGHLRGISQRNGTAGVNCFSSQPALNYGFSKIDDPSWQQPVDAPGPMATRKEIKNIMKFWLSMGCDGFRVDMAGSLVKNEDDNKEETIKIWQDIRGYLDQDFPNAVLVSEWGKPGSALKAGFHMDFFLHVGDTGYQDLFRVDQPFFGGDKKGNIADFVKHYMENRAEAGEEGMMCMPSGNHDMERISYKLDEKQLKLAFSFIYSLPGAPFLYYGDEIGMRYIPDMISVEGAYERTGSRTPMQWDKSVNCGFSSAPENKLYIALDPAKDRPDVVSQMEDKNSLLLTVRNLIAVRKQQKALDNDAGITFLYAEENTYPFLYKCSKEEETVYILLNPSDQEQECSDFGIKAGEFLFSYGEQPDFINGKIIMKPCSAFWIK